MGRVRFVLLLALVFVFSGVSHIAEAAWSKTYFKEYVKHKLKLKKATGVPRSLRHTYRLEGPISIWRDKINKRKPIVGKTKTSIKSRDEIHKGYAVINATWDGKLFKEEVVFSKGLKGKLTTHIKCKSDPYLNKKVKGEVILHGNTTGHKVFTEESERKRRPLTYVDASLATGLSLQAAKKPSRKPAKPSKKPAKPRKGPFGRIRSTGKTKDVKRFKVSFPDFAMTIVPSKRQVQFSVRGMVVSYGRDWTVKSISKSVFHLKQANWKGFYWQYDGRRGSLEVVRGGRFGRYGIGKRYAVPARAKKVGGGNISITFTKATTPYLICSASQKGRPIQVIVKGNVISYGSDWKVSHNNKKVYSIGLKTWRGFIWLIDCNKKRAYQVRGGKTSALPFKVDVVK